MRVLRRFPVFMATLVAMTMMFARPASAQVVVLRSTMLGANEVPGPGDPKASGSTVVMLDSTSGKVCYIIKSANVSMPPLTAGHIHIGNASTAGPVVIPLPLKGGPHNYGGCTTASTILIQSIIANPSGFYTNVHDAQFPGGVMRGQLHT